MNLTIIAFVFNFIISCWPKTNVMLDIFIVVEFFLVNVYLLYSECYNIIDCHGVRK